jgi:hypothetical protein
MGDGHQVTCPGPGTPYDPDRPNQHPDCSYVYQHSGVHTVTATMRPASSAGTAGPPRSA